MAKAVVFKPTSQTTGLTDEQKGTLKQTKSLSITQIEQRIFKNNSGITSFYTVPIGKTLIIEYACLSIDYATTATANANGTMETGGTQRKIFLETWGSSGNQVITLSFPKGFFVYSGDTIALQQSVNNNMAGNFKGILIDNELRDEFVKKSYGF